MDEERLGYYALFLAITKNMSRKEAFAALGAPVSRESRPRSHKKKPPEPEFRQMTLSEFMDIAG